MLTLLSPAKSLDMTPVENGIATTRPRFSRDTAVLMKRCKELSVSDLRKLMKLSEGLGELNYQRFQEMRRSSSPANAKPALLAFQGDVYKKLDVGSLSKRDLNWAQRRLRILSGFYGLLRPLDLIQPYRLEMGTRLDTERGKDLYRFWGARLAEALNAEEQKGGVLNLASAEYSKAVPEDALDRRMIDAVFQEIRDGQPKTIGFLAKKARGLMARFVIQNRISSTEGLKEFAAEGYRFRSDLSSDRRFVFTRERR